MSLAGKRVGELEKGVAAYCRAVPLTHTYTLKDDKNTEPEQGEAITQYLTPV